MLFCQLLATLGSSRRAHSSYSWRPVLGIEVKFREVPHWNSVRFTIKNNDTRAARRKLDVHAEMGSPYSIVLEKINTASIELLNTCSTLFVKISYVIAIFREVMLFKENLQHGSTCKGA